MGGVTGITYPPHGYGYLKDSHASYSIEDAKETFRRS